MFSLATVGISRPLLLLFLNFIQKHVVSYSICETRRIVQCVFAGVPRRDETRNQSLMPLQKESTILA